MEGRIINFAEIPNEISDDVRQNVGLFQYEKTYRCKSTDLPLAHHPSTTRTFLQACAAEAASPEVGTPTGARTPAAGAPGTRARGTWASRARRGAPACLGHTLFHDQAWKEGFIRNTKRIQTCTVFGNQKYKQIANPASRPAGSM